MPYILKNSNGTTLTTVADGSVNNSTSLTFVGRNYAGYGQILDQNLLYLLQNFSNNTSPNNPIQGQLWFNSSAANENLNVYDGSKFRQIPIIDLQPGTNAIGNFYFNTATNTLNIIDPGGLSQTIQYAASSGNIGSAVVTISDSANTVHSVLATQFNGLIVSVQSANSFLVNTSDPLYAAFPYVTSGITLANAPLASNLGIMIPYSGNLIWGSASNSITANKLQVTSNGAISYLSASVNTSTNSIAARDSSGNLYANTFVGNLIGTVINGQGGVAANSVQNGVNSMIFNWVGGTNGSPSYIWGSNTSTSAYAWPAGNTTVGFANTASYALSVNQNASNSWAAPQIFYNSANFISAVTFQNSSNVAFTGQTIFSNQTQFAPSKFTLINDGAATNPTYYGIGFKEIPQNVKLNNYSTVSSDSGKHLLFSANIAATFTIDDATVNYNFGTVITFVNMGTANLTIVLNGTGSALYLTGAGTPGSRTLAPYGVATAMKIGTLQWIMSGSGLS